MDNSCKHYTEKDIFTDALDSEKGATNLYNTFSNECVNPEVRNAMLDLLNEEHSIQFDVFNAMHDRGYYPTPAADAQKVAQLKQTHAKEVK